MKDVAAQAWHNTKDAQDPEFEAIPNLEFKGKLQYAADKVRETGIAQTNFEKEVARLHAEGSDDDAPMAVVDPQPGLDAAGVVASPAEDVRIQRKSEEPKVVKAPAKTVDESPSKKKAASTPTTKAGSLSKKDPSTHVPTEKEKAAIAKEQKNAPAHP
jgi:hypothetical protein